RLAQADTRHDHAVVGRDQVLLAAVLNRTHALLDRRVLHGDAGDAAIGLVGLLRGAIDQVVVVLVHHRPQTPGYKCDGDAAPIAHGIEPGRGERPRGRVGEAPGHAVLVTARPPGVAVEGVLAVGWNHAVERHAPLGDAPVEMARLRRPAHADD